MTQIATFLAAAGWADAPQAPLAGDASARRYLRLTGPREHAILMIAPAQDHAGFAAFLTMAAYLQGLNLSAPRILAADQANGLMLLEDLGDVTLAQVEGTDRNIAYAAAAALLQRIARAPLAPGLVALNPSQMAGMANLTFDLLGDADDLRGAILPGLAEALATHAGGAPVTALRDYHAENLMWLPDRHGDAQVGLLDFQDAAGLPAGYDLASLLDDVRRDVPADLRQTLIADFADRAGTTVGAATARIDVLSLQRNLRILGVFRRLSLSGKPRYLRFLPRTSDTIRRVLASPALSGVAAPVAQLLDRTAPWADGAI